MVTADSITKKLEKHLKIIETTYQNNHHSDYTEKIEHLYKNYNYASNSNYYWTEPEQSLLYGTPVYEFASSAQKLALNHNHWSTVYIMTADTETETVAYNQITGSVFAAYGYETLARELELETAQELVHISAFRKIGYKTMKELLGADAFKAPITGKSREWVNYGEEQTLNFSNLIRSSFLKWENSSLASLQYNVLRSIAQTMLKKDQQYYSQYLQELDKKSNFIPASTAGLVGRGLSPKSLQRFFTFNWGGSPFLASQYYSLRILGNSVLKNTEHKVSKYFKSLTNKGEIIPTPTAVSHYHFLDESFHATTSLVLSRDIYKDFPKPTAYEKFIINLALYMMQHRILNGISAISPGRYYADDYSTMYCVYKVLQSSAFGMSTQEALHWMKKCFCEEHQGFHTSANYYQKLRSNLSGVYTNLDYLWSFNRELNVMATGGSVDKAIQRNIKTFTRFSKLITSEH